jgi:hypothetical protein
MAEICLLTNKGAAHKELYRLDTVTKAILRDRAEEIEEGKIAPGRIANGLKPSPGKICKPMAI